MKLSLIVFKASICCYQQSAFSTNPASLSWRPGTKISNFSKILLGKATVRIFYQEWVYFENINFNITKIKIAVFKWMINHTASRNQNLYKLNVFLKVVCYLSTSRCWWSNNSIYQICRSVSEEHRIDAHFLLSLSHFQTNIYSLFFLKKNRRS